MLSLSPTYGPESGGTRISVGGGYFGDDLNGTVINLGDISCLINLEERYRKNIQSLYIRCFRSCIFVCKYAHQITSYR